MDRVEFTHVENLGYPDSNEPCSLVFVTERSSNSSTKEVVRGLG